ncbi:transporter substrate-binding domain-containing protein [Methanococcus maripaludis]|uniref:ABC-type amino acid transport substrate-binding protein n=1 Tax=Methanococcus maripaludis TaxID=39152 RepID=A0A7J9PX17_METMI|nr:transporter substrate-binding domain-containing protein [Methanococcus maripaludis]MBA2869460.1 ABC-type amino acid transport substrate-binding protein [Methanococcus maripaludis]
MIIVAPKIQNNDSIVVGIYPHMPPYQYLENGELKGFEIDLINELGQRMDKKIIFVETD